MSRYISTHMDDTEIKSKYDSIAYYIMLLFIGVGLYFRMKGLGKWSFTNDEYYLAQSVRNILENGLPSFKYGGYYVRSILYQYVMVPFVALGLREELIFRLVPVLSSLILVPAIYQLGKKVSGALVASLVIIILSVSTVEIEISRYARMYLPFQALFLWYLLFLYKAIVENDAKARFWMYGLSLLSLFVFEGSIFLAILNFLPFIKNTEETSNWPWHFFLSILILLLVYAFLSFNFRHYPLGLDAFWPPDIIRSPTGIGGIYKPLLMIMTITSFKLWLILYAIPLTLSLWGIYRIARATQLDAITRMSLSLLIVFAIANLYGLLLLATIIFLLLDLINPRDLNSTIWPTIPVILATHLVFWICYGLVTDAPAQLLYNATTDGLTQTLLLKTAHYPSIISRIIHLLLILFNYPFGFFRIFYGWFSSYPILISTCALLTGGGILWAAATNYTEHTPFRFLAAVMLILMMSVGLLHLSAATRYTFFLFPVVLLLSLSIIYIIIKTLFKSDVITSTIVIALFLGLILLSEDINFNHLRKIDTAEITFRKSYSSNGSNKVGLYIVRRDYKNVAEVLDRETKENDIVISAHQTVDYYTNKVDYILFSSELGQFSSYTTLKGKKERWTNLDLIYNMESLFDILENAETPVWIVVNLNSRRQDEINVLASYGDRLYFAAQDGILGVLKIEKDKEKVTGKL